MYRSTADFCSTKRYSSKTQQRWECTEHTKKETLIHARLENSSNKPKTRPARAAGGGRALRRGVRMLKMYLIKDCLLGLVGV